MAKQFLNVVTGRLIASCQASGGHPLRNTATMVQLAQAATVRRASRSMPVARVLGVHLEGPFLSASHHGAHDPRWLLPPAPAHIDRLLAASQGSLALITLAPELEGGLETVRKLTSAGAWFPSVTRMPLLRRQPPPAQVPGW